MAGQTTIVDASVGFKWLADEEGTEFAVRLLNEHLEGKRILLVPDLFFYEMLNAARYKRSDDELISSFIQDITDFQLMHFPVSAALLIKAGTLAIKHGLTIYDATYLALAEINDCELFTCDKKLLGLKHPLVRGL